MGDEFGISQLHPVSGEVLASMSVGPLASVSAHGEMVLFGSYVNNVIALADAVTGEVSETIEVECPGETLLVGEDEAWVVSPCLSQVAQVTLGTGVTRTFDIAFPHSIVLGGDGAVWVAGDRRVVRINRQSYELAEVLLPRNGDPTTIAVRDSASDDQRIWVSAMEPFGSGWRGALLTIDPRTLDVTRIDEANPMLQLPLESLAMIRGDPWVVGFAQGGNWLEVPRVVTHVDPDTNVAVEQYGVPAGAVVLADGPDASQLWLSRAWDLISVAPAAGDGSPVEWRAGAIGGLTVKTDAYAGDMPVDIYTADGASGVPVYVLVGGGPVPPSERHHMSPLATVLTDRGAVAMVIGYRSGATGNGMPDGVADVRCAVAFARERAADFGGDADNVILVGFSFGGELVLQAATGVGEASADCVADGDSSPDGAVALGGFPFGIGESAERPRLLLISGSEDGNLQRGRSLSERLLEHGFDAAFVELAGVNHPGVIDPAQRVGVVDELLEFAAGN